jgi:hypothetical protein
MSVAIVNSSEVDLAWPMLAPLFQQAIDRCGDDLSTGELWQMCRSGSAFLIYDAEDGHVRMGCIVQFQRWTGGPVLRVLALAGEQMAEWIAEFDGFIERMMKDGGADRLVFEGREWAAYLRAKGRDARKLRSTFEVRL